MLQNYMFFTIQLVLQFLILFVACILCKRIRNLWSAYGIIYAVCIFQLLHHIVAIVNINILIIK